LIIGDVRGGAHNSSGFVRVVGDQRNTRSARVRRDPLVGEYSSSSFLPGEACSPAPMRSMNGSVQLFECLPSLEHSQSIPQMSLLPELPS
jgi:hypothetical protein